MKLTEKKIKQAKPREKEYLLTDGHGLSIVIKSNVQKYWIHRFTLKGIRTPIYIGVYPKISLEEARKIHTNNKILISKGINPKKLNRNQRKANIKVVANTLKSIADKYFKEVYIPNTSPNTWSKIIPYFANDIYPFKELGNKSINNIKPLDLYEACKKISDRGARSSAKKVSRVLANIYSWAQLLGITHVNTAYGLSKILPNHKKGKFNSVTNSNDFAKVLNKIENVPDDKPKIKAFLKLIPLVFSEQGDLRAMKWSQINFIKAEWSYFRGKKINNKGGDLSVVPLSNQAIEIIKALLPYKIDSDYIFFSDKSYSGYISDSVVLKYLRACGVTKEETTLNGFRTSALTIGEEALGIGIGILKKRAEAMQKWADYCDQCKNPWKVKPVSSTKKFLWQK